jgi:hypothetical protein
LHSEGLLWHSWWPDNTNFLGQEFRDDASIIADSCPEDVMHSNNAYYLSGCNATGAKGASLEAKILLPFKKMAFGTASHAFCHYFQMSKPLAVRCCDEFALMIKDLYSLEYLWVPDENDLKGICRLHRAVHGVNVMMGSLCISREPSVCCSVVVKSWHDPFTPSRLSK